jgi:hypothetical protein
MDNAALAGWRGNDQFVRGSYDVGSISQGQLSQLAHSSNAGERLLGTTIANARRNYAQQLQMGARITATTSPGNGGYPVLTVTGPHFDPNRPARVTTLYHGDRATVADPVGRPGNINERIAQTQRSDPQMVFVLPEAKNARQGSYSANWSNVSSQVRTTADALRAAGVRSVDRSLVATHSRGGDAISYIMSRHPDGSGLRADGLQILDSLYGSENAIARWARTPNGQRARNVTYYHGSNKPGRDRVLANAFRPGVFHRVNASGHYDTIARLMNRMTPTA